MKTPQDVIDAWTAKMKADPQRIAKLDATYKFVIGGSGGGSWLFRCKEPLSVSKGEQNAECTIIMNADDFVALGKGELNPQAAFMSGRLNVEGDLELALRLGELMEPA